MRTQPPATGPHPEPAKYIPHPHTFYPYKIRFNIALKFIFILPSMARSPKINMSPSGFPIKILYNFFILRKRDTRTANFILHFITLLTFGEELKLWSSLYAYWVWGSYRGAYEEICILGYNVVSVRRNLTLNRLHGVMSQKIELFLIHFPTSSFYVLPLSWYFSYRHFILKHPQSRAHTGSSLANFSTLKMVALLSSETSVHTWSTRRHIPENGILQSYRRENLKSYNFLFVFRVKDEALHPCQNHE
jgi:hypothetical protein